MSDGRGKRIEISIIIPVKDEEKNVEALVDRIKSVLENHEHEIIFVDDGSTDDTINILKKINKKNKSIKVIQFKQNFGKSDALSAGFRMAKGDIVVTMDGDLQDDPAEIPGFIKMINEGWDVAVGWRYPRNDPLLKIMPSKIFNKLTSVLTGLRIHDINCGFKAFRNEVIKDIRLYGELHRYIPVIVAMKGFSVTEMKIKHHKRAHGKSKFGTGRLIKGFIDLITVKFLMEYSKKPLHFFGSIGLVTFLSGALINLYLVFLWLRGMKIGDRPLLMLGVLLVIISIQFVSIGLLGEMIVSSYQSDEDYKIKSIID